jgi:hypothetical protein
MGWSRLGRASRLLLVPPGYFLIPRGNGARWLFETRRPKRLPGIGIYVYDVKERGRT